MPPDPMRLLPLALALCSFLTAAPLALLLVPTASAQPVYDTADPMPTIRGGIEALQSVIAYPVEAREAGLSGRVLISFVVDARGEVADAAVMRSAHPLLDEAALAAIRQARFEPGRLQGTPVAVRMVLPITFAIDPTALDAREDVGGGATATLEEIAVQVDEMPRIVGGLDAVVERIAYPAEAAAAGIEGRVFVMFVVDEDGAVAEAEVVQPVHPLLDEAALAAVRATRFQPGRHGGRPVRVQMVLPITFTLPDRG